MCSPGFSFKGLMAPVFTPFDEDKNVNLRAIPDYARYLDSNGIKGILVNGTTGEGVSMTSAERKDVLHAWVKACHPYGQTIMVQVGGTNLKDVKSLARDAQDCKVSSILCLPDLFFKPSTVDDLIAYLKIVSKEAPQTPLLYYHIPSFTGVNLSMKELLGRASEVPTLVGIKFTDNDLAMGTSCVTMHSNKYSVFLGSDSLLLPALVQGFDSAIGTTINVFPTINQRIVTLFNEGNYVSAAAEQRNLNNYIERITKCGSWVSSMKAAFKKFTNMDMGPVRDPLLEVDHQKI